MTFVEALRMAWRGLVAHRFRSLLTVLSITVGAFAIVLMSSLAQSGLSTLERGIEDLGGARLIMISPKAAERAEEKQSAYARGFSSADRDVAFTSVPHLELVSLFAARGTVDALSDSGGQGRSDLVGGDARFFEAFKMPVAYGRAFSEGEDAGGASVCVVGPAFARKMWDGQAVGRFLTVGGLRCRVIGEMVERERLGVGFGFDWTDVVVVPLGTLESVSGDDARSSAIALLRTDGPASNEIVKRVDNARLSARHHGLDDYAILDFNGFLSKFEQVFAIMEAIVALLAGTALVIGGVGVMNMMLVSVSERVREIGVRKALGARPFDITRQFLFEASLLSSLGGAVGIGSGLVASSAASILIVRFLPSWQPTLSWIAAAVAAVVSMGIGCVFGWLPARRAARLDPVTAMRR